MEAPTDTIPFEGKITKWTLPMKIKHTSSGVEYNVNEETATNIQSIVGSIYANQSVYTIPLACKRHGDTVISAAWHTAGGPQPYTNGHGQTGPTSSTSATNGATGT